MSGILHQSRDLPQPYKYRLADGTLFACEPAAHLTEPWPQRVRNRAYHLEFEERQARRAAEREKNRPRPRVGYRHDSRAQTAHVLARHGWLGSLADRLTGYRGRNDQMARQRAEEGLTCQALAASWGLRARSTAWRAEKEAKARAVAVSEAIRAKMAREPLAEVEFSFLRPLRTDLDTAKKRASADPPTPDEEWFKDGETWRNRFFKIKDYGNDMRNASATVL